MGLRPPGNAAFTRYWIAETLLALGQEIFMVAVGWQIYDLTGSALALGLIGLAQFLPQCLLALVAGCRGIGASDDPSIAKLAIVQISADDAGKTAAPMSDAVFLAIISMYSSTVTSVRRSKLMSM